MKNVILMSLLSTFVFGCTSTSMTLNERDNAYSKYIVDEALVSKDKITGFKFSGWKSLSDNYLIVTATHKKDYLIQTKGKCYELNESNGIKLNRSSNLALYQAGDSISPMAANADKCRIKSIYPITSVQTDYLVGIGKLVKN